MKNYCFTQKQRTFHFYNWFQYVYKAKRWKIRYIFMIVQTLYKVFYRRKQNLCRYEIQYWVEQKLTKDIV